MNFWNLLRGAFPYTDDAKPLSANDVDKSTQAEESMTPESAKGVKQNKTLSEGRLMTKTDAQRRVAEWCKSQIGYHEGLDGSNKYADGIWDKKLYGFDAKNVPWCDVFVDYAFIHCFGYDDGVTMTYQQNGGYAACSLSAQAYKDHDAFYHIPEVGDQIFFVYSEAINHTGVVVEVGGDVIVCVEGNYSDSVCRTQYRWKENSGFIAGYGRPNWAVVAEPESIESDDTIGQNDDIIVLDEFDNVHPEHRRAYMHLEYGDGFGNPLPQVRAWQNLLICWGIDIGEWGADGEYGTDTENATKDWQRMVKDWGADVEVNGIVDEDDWKEIIFLEV